MSAIMKYQAAIAVALAVSGSYLAFAAPAQEGGLQMPAASPPALVREQVGLTTIEIEYSRPGVKGRDIFGGLIPYDAVWRTGANAATKITFSGDVSFGGEPVSAGTYALFTIPGEKEWTVILNEVAGQWGSYAYDANGDVARVQAKVDTLAESVETMSIGLQNLRDDSGGLAITWDKTRVVVPVQTDLVATLVPQIEAAMSADGAQKPYLQAAMFFYEHDIDLPRAVEWMDKALEGQPGAPWVLYRKGLILAKLGEVDAAIEVAKQAIAAAELAGGELGEEYTRLSTALITRLEKP